MRPVHKLTIAAAICIVSGIALMLWTFLSLKKWEPVQARVLSSELIPFTIGKVTRYRGELRLVFITGDRKIEVPYSVPSSSTSYEAARDNLLRYRVGSTATIYVNPKDPQDIQVDKKDPVRSFALPFGLISVSAVLAFISVRMYISMQRCLCPSCAASVALHHRFCLACGHKLPRKSKWIRQ